MIEQTCLLMSTNSISKPTVATLVKSREHQDFYGQKTTYILCFPHKYQDNAVIMDVRN